MAQTTTPVLPFDVQPPDEETGTRQLAVVPQGREQLALVPLGASQNVAAATAAYTKKVEMIKKARVEPDQRSDMARWADQLETEKKETWTHWLIGLLTIILALIDNVLAFITFATVRAFHGRLYNIVDLHLTLLPALDIVLLFFAALGTATFAAMIVAIECLRKPLFHELMNFRLLFSALPCGIICGVILYHSERTQPAPFATLVAVLINIFVWCFHMRVYYSSSLNVMSRISLDISWFIALICGVFLLVLYLADELQVITNSDGLGCPYTPNDRMPVHVLTLGKWYCAPWSNKGMELLRAPVNSEPVRLSCSETFVSAFTVSIEPHKFECPVGCLRNYDPGLTKAIVGCGVYAADSSICIAAIHAGALTDSGGQGIVYGRLGAASFKGCSRNSISSSSLFVLQEGSGTRVSPPSGGERTFSTGSGGRRLLTTPAVIGPGGQQVPQAFHFNNLPETREYLWLKSYDKVPSTSAGVEDDKPWTRIEATVSARLAGIELDGDKIRLGSSSGQELFVQPRPGQVFRSSPAQCSIHNSGVLCNGAGSAVVQLDFCRKEVKECPDE
mmetsp:Transcript_6185/g.11425  ORF Transcript_6185/g.11425 Transcript_6185/m.11425 type:complete len:561 (-) Transcript_6185:99-1781(-)